MQRAAALPGGRRAPPHGEVSLLVQLKSAVVVGWGRRSIPAGWPAGG